MGVCFLQVQGKEDEGGKGCGPRTIALDDCDATHDEWATAPVDGELEDEMAKGQLKGNKEAKKPKADKPKGSGSAYKQSQGKGGASLSPTSAKKG
jgi:hypothetical protein